MTVHKWHILVALMLGIALIFGLGGCGPAEEEVEAEEPEEPEEEPEEVDEPEEEPEARRIIWAFESGPRNLDAHDQTGSPDFQICMWNVYEGLMRLPSHFPEDGTPPAPELALAESFEMNEDGTEWTFRIREGVQFHHGYGELTARDVKFSYDRLLDPDSTLRGSAHVGAIDRVEIVDDYTVTLFLKEPYAPLEMSMADESGHLIVSKDAVLELGDEEFARSPVGTGPYKVTYFEPGDEEAHLERFEDYWGPLPQVKEARVIRMSEEPVAAMAMIRDEIQWMTVRDVETFEILSQEPDLVSINRAEGHSYSTFCIWLNVLRVEDVRTRQALIHALDRQMLLDEFLYTDHVQVAHSPVALSVRGHAEDVIYDYDPDRARELVAEAGDEGLEMAGNILDMAMYRDTFTHAQEAWGDIGIDLNFEIADRGAWTERRESGDYDFFTVRAGRREAQTALRHYHSEQALPHGTLNYSQYANPDVDDLFEMQSREMDPDARAEIVAEIQRILMEDAVVIPIAYASHVTAHSAYYTEGDNVGSWRFELATMEFVD